METVLMGHIPLAFFWVVRTLNVILFHGDQVLCWMDESCAHCYAIMPSLRAAVLKSGNPHAHLLSTQELKHKGHGPLWDMGNNEVSSIPPTMGTCVSTFPICH